MAQRLNDPAYANEVMRREGLDFISLTRAFHADPHYEEDLSTETGGLMFFVQYQGPTTGGRPIYDGRFNVAERKPLSEEWLDV